MHFQAKLARFAPGNPEQELSITLANVISAVMAALSVDIMAAMLDTSTYLMVVIGIIILILGVILRSKGRSVGLALALIGVILVLTPPISAIVNSFGGASNLGLAPNVAGAIVIILGLGAGAYAVRKKRS